MKWEDPHDEGPKIKWPDPSPPRNVKWPGNPSWLLPVHTEQLPFRQLGSATVKWNHVDGPMLMTSYGRSHWLTLWQRALLWARVTTIQAISNKLDRREWKP